VAQGKIGTGVLAAVMMFPLVRNAIPPLRFGRVVPESGRIVAIGVPQEPV
jgi:hypothetical protein